MTKSLDPIVVTALQVDFPGESHGPATFGFARNCPEPKAWTTGVSGRPGIVSCLMAQHVYVSGIVSCLMAQHIDVSRI